MAGATMDKIVSLCKRRGFLFQGSELYGGLQGTWDYGPMGVELKNNVKRAWWRANVYERDDIEGLDAAIPISRRPGLSISFSIQPSARSRTRRTSPISGRNRRKVFSSISRTCWIR